MMNHQGNIVQELSETGLCPYCNEDTNIDMPDNYAPVYVYCGSCNKKFIVERLSTGFQLLTLEAAAGSCSDPDFRAIEMGGSDEQ